jgi:hypothetical protein
MRCCYAGHTRIRCCHNKSQAFVSEGRTLGQRLEAPFLRQRCNANFEQKNVTLHEKNDNQPKQKMPFSHLGNRPFFRVTAGCTAGLEDRPNVKAQTFLKKAIAFRNRKAQHSGKEASCILKSV